MSKPQKKTLPITITEDAFIVNKIHKGTTGAEHNHSDADYHFFL